MNKSIKEIIKENLWFFISLFIIALAFNCKLPYYIKVPGGTININDRIDCKECKKINGNLNMLYVSEYEATIPTFLLSYIMPNWDKESIEEQQVSNESPKDIYERGRVMLENSVNSATKVAYQEAGKKIEVEEKKIIVIATTLDNGLKIGDEILKVDEKEITDVEEIREIIKEKEKNTILKITVKRDNKTITVDSTIKQKKNIKQLGVIIVNNYSYKTEPEIDIKFKSSESGSSGGLMMALSIYTKISKEDIVKGRNIAGTGTIDEYGNVGEIDGVKYKIMGAAKNNIDIVLVPKENYKEAIKIKEKNHYKMKIVKVETFKDAINYLKK